MPPAGAEFFNPALADALNEATEFTQEELAALGVNGDSNLSYNSFVRVGRRFFSPVLGRAPRASLDWYFAMERPTMPTPSNAKATRVMRSRAPPSPRHLRAPSPNPTGRPVDGIEARPVGASSSSDVKSSTRATHAWRCRAPPSPRHRRPPSPDDEEEDESSMSSDNDNAAADSRPEATFLSLSSLQLATSLAPSLMARPCDAAPSPRHQVHHHPSLRCFPSEFRIQTHPSGGQRSSSRRGEDSLPSEVRLGSRSGDQGEEVGRGSVYDGREKAAPSALYSPAKLAESAAAPPPRLPQRLRDPAVFRAELSALRAKVESLRLDDNRGPAACRVRVVSLFTDEQESESAVIAT